MPEGPEVRKYADALNSVLKGRVVTALEARTREARAWLRENENRVVGNRVDRVISHGKHLIGYIDRGFYFHSHLMMWGSWHTFPPTESIQSNRKKPVNSLLALERDRRERARILVEGGAAILFSAPIFNVGEGDPYEQIEILGTLGPDALSYDEDLTALSSSGGSSYLNTAKRQSALHYSTRVSWPAWETICAPRSYSDASSIPGVVLLI